MAKMSGLSKSLSSGKKKSSSKKKGSKKKIRHTHIEHGDDGSHVIRHSFDQGGAGEEPTPDALHGVGDNDALAMHMQDQFPPSAAMTPAAPAPAPASPAGAAPGGM